MGKSEEYRAALKATPAERWGAWLAARSGLPGPRANLELAQVVADEAPPATLRRYAGAGDDYLALCGAVGLGRLLAEGDPRAAGELAALAADGRWRVREGVAWACNASATPTCRGQGASPPGARQGVPSGPGRRGRPGPPGPG
jgi:hypothetical protein